MAGTNPILRALRRMGASNAELESEQRQKVVEAAGAKRIGAVRDREMATLRGTITVPTMKPAAAPPGWRPSSATARAPDPDLDGTPLDPRVAPAASSVSRGASPTWTASAAQLTRCTN